MRLFCFTYAGGSAMVFRTWSDRLPKEVEVCPIELPGRGRRLQEAPFISMPALVTALAEALLSRLDMPFALFGHSMGAIIGFELARHARREQYPQPLHLFVSGRQAPQIPDPDRPTYDLSEPDFLDDLHRLNGTPQEVLRHPELMALLLPALRADFTIIQTYAYSAEPQLDCSISAYGGLQDRDVSREQLEAWREQTTATFSLQMFSGDHFFLNTNQPLLLQVLSRELHSLLQNGDIKRSAARLAVTS